MNIQIGDTVRVWKYVYDSEYAATGVVEKINGDMLYVGGDWWKNTNDLTNKCELVAQKRATGKPQAAGWVSMDISSGLGIGGVGSDDFDVNSDLAAGSYTITPPHKWGGTRYDESCARCGRVTEICNDCELCENCHK